MGEPVDVQFEALDGWVLTGSWFVGDAPHTVLVLNSGTGIPRRFYRRFAGFAASKGFAVLTYDYRGIGGSRPDDLLTSGIVYRDWGQRDIPGALQHARERYPDLPLTVVGHSTGGQQLGLAPNVGEVDAALFVAVSTGYWAGMPLRMKAFTFALWTLIVPVLNRAIGYFPADRFGLGEDLPAGVAAEWGAWCLEPTYLGAFLEGSGHRTSPDGRPFGPDHFEHATFPLHALCFTDDDIATPANVPPMLRLYANAQLQTRWVEPEEVGKTAIGHLGFFRKQVGGGLWDETLEGLRAAAR